MSIMKLFHSLGRKLTAKTLRDYPYRLKHKGIAQIPDVGEAESTGAQMYQTLVDAGLKPEDMHKFIKSEKEIIKYLNIIKSTRKQALEQATKKSKDILKVTKKKERPFTGWTPKVVERSMSADDYAALKEEWFSRIMTNTDEALNTFLKRGINASDERFASLSKNQRKDFLDMVQYRLKHGNEKFMNDFTDDKGVFNNFPEELAYGGLAGMLGERTGFDIGGGIFSSTPDTAVKFNLDGETIFLNPDFFEVFMGPYMDDPEKFKRRTDDLKQEIRRNQSTVALADGGVAGLLGERPGYDEGKEVINYDKDANYRGWKKLYEVNPDIAAMNENHSKYEQYYKSKQNSKALGGRVPFAMGRRAFLKLLGVGGAGIAGLKTGVGLGGKKAATEVAKDVLTTSGPPPYFFNLVNKIKTLGDDTLASKDKAIAKKYKDYTMEEDFAGNIEIIKKGGDDMFPEDVYMSYRVDEVPLKGKKGSTKVEEYEEYTARPDIDGKMKDVEGGVPDEVIEEGTIFEDNMTDFGKADGGIARMLGE